MTSVRRRVRAAATIAVISVLVAAAFLLRPATATYIGKATTPGTVVASTVFPGQPALITKAGPVFYHRGEEAQSGAATSTALDSSGQGQNGTYDATTNGTSLWWRMDDDATATTLDDSSGAADTGRASASGMSVPVVAGPTGGAHTLGPSTNALFATSTLSSAFSPFRADRSFTVSAWFNLGSTVPADLPGDSAGIVHMTNSSYKRSDVVLEVDGSTSCPGTPPCWAFAMAQDPNSTTVTGWDTVRGTTLAAANAWTLITGVFTVGSTTGTMSLYVNGAPQGTTVTHTIPATAATSSNVGIGRYRDSSTWLGYGDGTAAAGETRSWRRALSATEVAALPVRATSRWNFNETSGTPGFTGASAATGAGTVTARSTTGVTVGAGASLAAGRDGNALTIPAAGATGYVQGPAAQVNTNGSFSVAAWAKLTSAAADRVVVAESGSNSTAFVLGYDQASNRWIMRMWQANSTLALTTTISSAAAPVLNQWTHLAAVFDDTNNQLRLYVNGRPTTPVGYLALPWAATSAVQIGRRLTADPWQGQIDDVRIYNGYALTDTAAALAFGSLAAEQPGGLLGVTKTGHSGSTAVAFGGTSSADNGKYASTAAPAAGTVECLVRVAAGDNGVIAGFADAASGLGATASDRLLYVDAAGLLRFGVISSGAPVVVTTATPVDDGEWHHVMASVGAAGLKLYLDGVLVKNTSVTSATSATGYWRWGGTPMLPVGAWPAAPGNPYLTGTIDEFAVYATQLTDQDDLWRVYGNY